MTSSAMQAMDLHTNICTSLHNSSLTTQLDRCLWIDSVDDGFSQLSEQHRLEFAKQFVDIEHTYVSEAQTIYVSDAIIDEIQYAANKMPDNVLLEQDVFVPNGLIILETPMIYELPVDDNEIIETWSIGAIHFLSNAEGQRLRPKSVIEGLNGIRATLYGNWLKTHNVKLNETLAYNHDTREPEFYKSDGTISTITNDFIKSLLGDHTPMTQWGFLLQEKAQGTPRHHIDATYYEYGVEGDYSREIASIKKFLLALFRMTYSYLEPENTPVERHTRKRAERANRKIPENGYLTVLKLRRTEYEHGETKHNSPKYAFRVRGHWRNQYYPTKGEVGNPNAYRHVYVNDYIKGKDKELRESTRVITMNR